MINRVSQPSITDSMHFGLRLIDVRMAQILLKGNLKQIGRSLIGLDGRFPDLG